MAALKPVETGCTPDPRDALALALACGRPDLATASGLYRADLPLSPHAVALETGAPAPDFAKLSSAIRSLAHGSDCVIVEGAGGLLVPLDATHTIADLARELAFPLVLVAPDTLGVISHVLTAVESARSRNLALLAIVLVARADSATSDPSPRTNRHILTERCAGIPVLAFPHTHDADDALADAAEQSGLVARLCLRRPAPE